MGVTVVLQLSPVACWGRTTVQNRRVTANNTQSKSHSLSSWENPRLLEYGKEPLSVKAHFPGVMFAGAGGHHATLDAAEPCPVLLCGFWQSGLRHSRQETVHGL